MSGTHFGTCVLHVTPEAVVGGPLALVRSGDMIELDLAAGTLNMLVDDAELAQRRASWQAPAPSYLRGYSRLYVEHVTQADQGCDLDFLLGSQATPEPPIF
jgi:dihydroxy-acid dehydratase